MDGNTIAIIVLVICACALIVITVFGAINARRVNRLVKQIRENNQQ